MSPEIKRPLRRVCARRDGPPRVPGPAGRARRRDGRRGRPAPGPGSRGAGTPAGPEGRPAPRDGIRRVSGRRRPDAGLFGQAQGRRQALRRHRHPREPRAQSPHRGRRPARRPRGLPRDRPRRPVAARRDSGKSRRGPAPLPEARPRGEHQELRRRRRLSQDGAAGDGQGRLHGLLLGRSGHEPGGRQRARPGGGRPLLRQPAGRRGRPEDQGGHAHPLRRRRRAHQRRHPGLRGGPQKGRRSSTRSTCTRAPGTPS